MILTAFDLKFDETKDEIPLGACRPVKKMKKSNVQEVDHQKVKKQKNNVEKVDPTKVEKQTLSKKWTHKTYINHRKSTNWHKVHPPELVYQSLDFS